MLNIAAQLAFEFVAQGIWTAEDMYDFVEDTYSTGYNVGYDAAEFVATVDITG
jgi:hypothetical protein